MRQDEVMNSRGLRNYSNHSCETIDFLEIKVSGNIYVFENRYYFYVDFQKM